MEMINELVLDIAALHERLDCLQQQINELYALLNPSAEVMTWRDVP